VEEALAAAKRLDDFQFSPLLRGQPTGGNSSAEEIISLLEKTITHIHWFYLLEAMMKELAEKESAATYLEPSIGASIEEGRPPCQL
jgi:hypothetical protein